MLDPPAKQFHSHWAIQRGRTAAAVTLPLWLVLFALRLAAVQRQLPGGTMLDLAANLCSPIAPLRRFADRVTKS